MLNKKLWVTEKWEVELIESNDDLNLQNENEVLVRNHFTHLSAGTELACLSGFEGWFQFPDSPGYTGIGEVIAKGSAVEKVQKGDLVYTYSTHSQYFKLDTTDRWHGVCVPIPSGINPEWATFTHMAGIAMTALRISHVELGDHVLVTGQGVIGNLAAQLAQLQGAIVIATDLDDNRLKISQSCGIAHTINSEKQNLKEYLMEITSGKGVSCYIDATGLAPVVNQTADMVALNGEIILLGSPRAPFKTNLTNFLGHFHYIPFNHNLKGALEFSFPTHPDDFSKHSIERNAQIILELIKSEKLLIKPFYSHEVSPQNAQQVYEGLRDRPDEYIGVVFNWKDID